MGTVSTFFKMCISRGIVKSVKHFETLTTGAFDIVHGDSKELLITSSSGDSNTIKKDSLLLFSPLFRDIFGSVNNNEDISCITLADHEVDFQDDMKILGELLSLSWNTRKEIYLNNSTLDVLKDLRVDIPEVQSIKTVNEFIISCPNQPCQYQSQGSKNSRRNNLVEHLLKSHNQLQHQVAVNKCFPPHSRPKGFACRECHETFQGKGSEIREAHVRSKHKYLFDMKSVNKAVDGALDVMKEVKKNLVAKIRPVPMAEKLNNTKLSKQQRPSKKVTRKEKKKEYSILKTKSKKYEASRFEKADFNGNTHSSITLEELLNSNILYSVEVENDDNIFALSINAEINPTNNITQEELLKNVIRIVENENMIDSDNEILESSVNVEINAVNKPGPLKKKFRKGSKEKKHKN